MTHMTDFDLVESLFSRIMPALDDELFPSEIALISRFIDVGEYELALEGVIDIFVSHELVVSTDVCALVKALANAMDLPAKEFTDTLLTAGR